MRATLVKGFSHLLSKSVIASAVGFLSTLLVIYLIGVEEYGKFAGAFAVVLFLELLLKFEIKLVLLKADPEEEPSLYHTSFSLLMGISLVAILVVGLLLFFVPNSANPYKAFSFPLLVLIGTLPLAVVTEIPRAVLERKMRFPLISNQELGAALLQHTTTLLLIFIYESYLILVASWYVYVVSIAAFSFVASGYVPKLKISRESLTKLKNHSRHIFIQNLSVQAKKLANPVLVGYFAGAGGVGVVSFAEKIVQGFSFYKNAVQRVAASAAGAAEGNEARLRKLIIEGTLVQIVPIGIILLLGSVAVFGVSLWSGDDLWIWMNELYPFLATGFFYYILLTIPVIHLQMYDGLKDVTFFWMAFNVLFFLTAFFAIREWGIIGYGVAELAALPFYLLVFKSLKKRFGVMLSNDIVVVMLSIPIALFWYHIGYWSLFSLPMVFLFPELLKKYKQMWKDGWRD
ncbi:lipopolysaccharide biosynthesis protein [Gracilimonas mengyeensis]|uniref:Membrane protein involved in the export of O-antigen and teichoic acid n=1 Tax=Gracilimonas mengyeensis TaxID=1302730 RepID=A0A521FKL6_9BACT|nr:oligosaccharide flippase family protein [Gracilimonas mengyeensis]SMO96705.1 Membrane protein involved in the export of O-antigen and teichoic acid [Gracilimonas mengyeensis]